MAKYKDKALMRAGYHEQKIKYTWPKNKTKLLEEKTRQVIAN